MISLIEIISVLQSNGFKRQNKPAWVAPDGKKFIHAEDAYRYFRKLNRLNKTLKELVEERR